ncbi:MAG: hypothetical protein JHC93_07985 [Parachlamydiales bacterium]|nr:hypothetical protein [Parachlamydiales bacterium]
MSSVQQQNISSQNLICNLFDKHHGHDVGKLYDRLLSSTMTPSDVSFFKHYLSCATICFYDVANSLERFLQSKKRTLVDVKDDLLRLVQGDPSAINKLEKAFSQINTNIYCREAHENRMASYNKMIADATANLHETKNIEQGVEKVREGVKDLKRSNIQYFKRIDELQERLDIKSVMVDDLIEQSAKLRENNDILLKKTDGLQKGSNKLKKSGAIKSDLRSSKCLINAITVIGAIILMSIPIALIILL